VKTQDLCNNTYRDLCAQLGELSLQRILLEKKINEITAQLHLLNALSPQLQSIETDLINNNIEAGC